MFRFGLFIGLLCLTIAAPLRADPQLAAPRFQTAEQMQTKSSGCLSCHTASDAPTMHENKAIMLGCADCHGGNPNVMLPANAKITFGPSQASSPEGLAGHAPAVTRSTDPAYTAAMDAAHVQPQNPEAWNWPVSAKPQRSYTALNHESPEFIRFLNLIEAQVPAGKAIHVILDNYAAHKHPKVREWLVRHPRFTFHFTPTSCSWLNAVEGFFARLTNRRLNRGVFHSLVDLQAAINRFLVEHNESPQPFTWTADPDKIIAAVRRGHQVLDSNH